MKSPIQIVLVEDNPNDVEILRYELTKGGLSFVLTVVDNEKNFRSALSQIYPDIIISDYSLPMFSGHLALEITKAHFPDVPFLIVSGVIGEDVAIQLIKAGCSDYLLKDKLGRLCTSIQHALNEAEELRQKTRIQLELKESEERFRILADNSPVLIWKTDAEGICNYFNKGWLEFTGSTFDDQKKIGWGSWVHDDDKERRDEVSFKSFKQRKPFEIEYRLRRHDNDLRWILDKGAPNYLPNGEFIGFIGSCIDITDRIQSDIRLRETKELLDTFFTQTLDGCYFVMFTSPLEWNGTIDRSSVLRACLGTIEITEANIAFAQQFLSEQEQIVGTLFSSLFVRYLESERLLERLFDSSKVNYTAVMKRPNKTEIVVEGNAVCLYDPSRNIIGFYGIQRDITEEKKEFDTLRHKADFYQRLFEDDVTGDFVTQSDGTIIRVNQQCVKIFGYNSTEEMYELNVSSLYAHAEERDTAIALLLNDKKIVHYEFHGKRKDGTLFDGIVNASGKFDADGRLVEIVGMITDNSHRKEIEQQLLQAQKLESIGTLASGIAHDFNNILNNISGFSNQILKYYLNPEKVRKYAETINQSAKRGAQISTKLLAFVRQKNSEIGPLKVTDVINEVVDMCNETFMRSAEIKLIKEEHVWDVYGDKSSLYQLLLNLCVNSRDAINQCSGKNGPGLISISVKNYSTANDTLRWFGNKRPEKAVMISVSDNGSGIPDSIKEKIFDPFFTTKINDSHRGTGLGLSIVHNTVKHHHGAVTVDSSPDVGTTFSIYIPAVETTEHSGSISSDGIFTAKNNELILVVDDESSMRQLGTELLEEVGFRVVTASNGKEAVAIYRDRYKEIDLVVLDLVMPELDGGQTYVEMKKISSNVKAFFCSGFVTDSLISSLLAEENLRALQKPFDSEKFVQTVCEVLYK